MSNDRLIIENMDLSYIHLAVCSPYVEIANLEYSVHFLRSPYSMPAGFFFLTDYGPK